MGAPSIDLKLDVVIVRFFTAHIAAPRFIHRPLGTQKARDRVSVPSGRPDLPALR